MERELTIAEATESFAEIVARVQQHGERVMVTEKGQVVARIIPSEGARRFKTAAQILELWNDPSRPWLTPEEATAFEADLKTARQELPPLKDDPWE